MSVDCNPDAGSSSSNQSTSASASSKSSSTPSSLLPSFFSSSNSTTSKSTPIPQHPNRTPPTRAEIFQTTLSGARPPPLLPRLSSDDSTRIHKPLAQTLPEYVEAEGGPEKRLARLRALWEKLPDSPDAALSSAVTFDIAGTLLGSKNGTSDSKPGPSKTSQRDEASSSAVPRQDLAGLSRERAARLRDLYLVELAGRCKTDTSVSSVVSSLTDKKGKSRAVDWEGFVKYADDKEQELWNIFHNELDLDGNGHLDADEWSQALRKTGIELSNGTLTEFMTFLTSSPHSHSISFPEFRDFLLLMPRTASTAEIYRYYEVRKYYTDHDKRGAGRLTMEADVTLSAEELNAPSADHSSSSNGPPRSLEPPSSSSLSPLPGAPDSFPTHDNKPSNPSSTSLAAVVHDAGPAPPLVDHPPQHLADASQTHVHELDHEHDHEHDHDDEDDGHGAFGGMTAMKFLLAGGIAGVISRTATAPFDRLKVYLITASPEQLGVSTRMDFREYAAKAVQEGAKNGGAKGAMGGAVAGGFQVASVGSRALGKAVLSLYKGGGVKTFWVGNGLNSAKILPESAIKFLSYETSKRLFAKYYDHVEDSREISGVSRFISGGIGGITSQLVIYPVETLKTHIMSTKGGSQHILVAAKKVWELGGTRAFYRGLTIGLIGVFPYSAIDMSTFEALKLTYNRSTGKSEPGVLAMLAFGSVSGSVGATSVYPLNLVRTRLQASGSTGHPQRYTGVMDVVIKTYEMEGWRGFYKGLAPTLAKVIPAVSISYVVYEKSKKALNVA